MKLIRVEAKTKTFATKYKEETVTNWVNGVKIKEKVKTGVPDEMRIIKKIYWIPLDKIQQLYQHGTNYYINDIIVSEEEFNKVKNEIEQTS